MYVYHKYIIMTLHLNNMNTYIRTSNHDIHKAKIHHEHNSTSNAYGNLLVMCNIIDILIIVIQFSIS